MSTGKSGFRQFDEQFDCWQEANNREDRYAVSV